MNEIFLNEANQKDLIFTIVIGIITFSIPFLVLAYQKIFEINIQVHRRKTEDILSKKFYKSSLRKFYCFIYFPFMGFVLIGLIFIPLYIDFFIAIKILSASAVYLVLTPVIFNRIIEKSKINLQKYLRSSNEEDTNVKDIYSELFDMDDVEIEKEFGIKFDFLLEDLLERLGRLLSAQPTSKRINLVNDYLGIIRSKLSKRKLNLNLVSHFAELYFIVNRFCVSNKDKYQEPLKFEIEINLQRIVDNIIRELLSYCYTNEKTELITIYLNLLINSEEKLIQKYGSEPFIDLVKIFFESIFKNIETINKNVWGFNVFNNERLKVTIEKLKNNKLEDIHFIILEHFFSKVFDVLINYSSDGKKYYREIDHLIEVLFPEISPRIFSNFLIFSLSPYDPSNRVESIIDRYWPFGGIERVFVFWGDSEEANNDYSLFLSNQTQKTFEFIVLLTKKIFYGHFSWVNKEEISLYLNQLQQLKYPADSLQTYNQKDLLNLFKGLLKLL